MFMGGDLTQAGHHGARRARHGSPTHGCRGLNEEIQRRTRLVRIFPNPESCLRLVRALCAETREAWLEDNRYINMDLLKEQKKAAMKIAA
jgi:putative transposase